MKRNNILGIVFANSHDALLNDLSKSRSMASVPFGARYRMIDFTLSNLSNAGVSKVGIVTKANYFSLMRHLGTGKAWDLDRKVGGLSIYPPYSSAETQVYKGRVEALIGISECLTESEEEYVILCDSDVIANVDLKDMKRFHKEKNADMTIVFSRGKKPKGQHDIMDFKFQEDGKIIGVGFNDKTLCDYGLDIILVKRQLLIDLINEAYENRQISFSHGIIERKYKKLNIYGYRHDGFVAVMDSIDSFFDANMALLDASVRADLFNTSRPIHTDGRDDMPVKYGINAKVSNSIIADGCIIEGEVKNSILSREVYVGAGAVVENCILMDNVTVGNDSRINCVICDRYAQISEKKYLDGSESKCIIGKRQII